MERQVSNLRMTESKSVAFQTWLRSNSGLRVTRIELAYQESQSRALTIRLHANLADRVGIEPT